MIFAVVCMWDKDKLDDKLFIDHPNSAQNVNLLVYDEIIALFVVHKYYMFVNLEFINISLHK